MSHQLFDENEKALWDESDFFETRNTSIITANRTPFDLRFNRRIIRFSLNFDKLFHIKLYYNFCVLHYNNTNSINKSEDIIFIACRVGFVYDKNNDKQFTLYVNKFVFN